MCELMNAVWRKLCVAHGEKKKTDEKCTQFNVVIVLLKFPGSDLP